MTIDATGEDQRQWPVPLWRGRRRQFITTTSSSCSDRDRPYIDRREYGGWRAIGPEARCHAPDSRSPSRRSAARDFPFRSALSAWSLSASAPTHSSPLMQMYTHRIALHEKVIRCRHYANGKGLSCTDVAWSAYAVKNERTQKIRRRGCRHHAFGTRR